MSKEIGSISFNVTDYQFTAISKDGLETQAHMASVTLSAAFGRTQVFFVKVTSTTATFNAIKAALGVSSNLLEVMNEDLKIELAQHIPTYIRKLELAGLTSSLLSLFRRDLSGI